MTSSAKRAATAAKRSSSGACATRPRQPEKDPKGGLTAAGRAALRRKEGAHLRPGVQGAADTPEKLRRKGSFLRRHFANPRGPMVKDGKPTRLALSAHAWGEPVPKTMAAAKKLAAKGAKLLLRYERSKHDGPAAKGTQALGRTAQSRAAGHTIRFFPGVERVLPKIFPIG